MNKQSLLEARKLILKVLSNSNISTLDKLELMNNINILLMEENYEEHIQVLKIYTKHIKDGKKWEKK
jgi:hypothetical protein